MTSGSRAGAVTVQSAVTYRGAMRPVIVAALMVGWVALLAGCGGSGLPHDRADLRVHQVLSEHAFEGLYVEGWVSYVKLSASDGSSTQRRLDRRGRAEFGELAPGRYRLDSWLRTCDGYCGMLDSPTDRCSLSVTVEARSHSLATIILTPGHGCRIVY